MRKLLMVLLLAIPLAGSARMFPTEIPVKAICWDNTNEAIRYHQEILGEYPIGKGWINNKDGPSFAVIMFNPTRPSWTFLSFHQSSDGKVVACAVTAGTEWQELTPGDDEIEI
tara:strand:- start:150 stop:488 length:339 start_codon:yes stop_codon:yes gene_type:complete